MIKYWIWKLFNFPYVIPPGEYIVKDVRKTNRRLILDDVVLRREGDNMTFMEFTENKEREL